MARLTDVALFGPRLALAAGRTAVGLAPKVASAAGHLVGGLLGEGERPAEPSASEPTSAAKPPRTPTEEPSEGPGDSRPEDVEVPEVRSTVPQAVGGGFPEPPGKDPGDISRDPSPHHALGTPVGDPDPTEWPDPYDQREDPRDPPDPDGEPFGEEPHPHTGSTSTSEPHPSADIEAPDASPPRRDRIDD